MRTSQRELGRLHFFHSFTHQDIHTIFNTMSHNGITSVWNIGMFTKVKINFHFSSKRSLAIASFIKSNSF